MRDVITYCTKHEQPYTWHPAVSVNGKRTTREDGTETFNCRLCDMTLKERILNVFK